MAITTEQIKELREATGAGVLDCRTALEQANGDFEQAVNYLREKGLAKAAKRAGREASDGLIELYSHGGGRVGVMLEINCETDFVARSDAFRTLAHELALHVAAAAPSWISDEDVPATALEGEREVARNRAKEEGKPDASLDKIVDGRVQKYLDEVVLLRQPYVRDESKNIKELISEAVGSIGENIIVRRFARWELGEHVEK
ncbi:MAG: translation elongation factor Ts [Anaerolineales bacterium]